MFGLLVLQAVVLLQGPFETFLKPLGRVLVGSSVKFLLYLVFEIKLKITPGMVDLQGCVFCPSLCRSDGLIGKFKCFVKVHFAGLIKICLLVKLGDCS